MSFLFVDAKVVSEHPLVTSISFLPTPLRSVTSFVGVDASILDDFSNAGECLSAEAWMLFNWTFTRLDNRSNGDYPKRFVSVVSVGNFLFKFHGLATCCNDPMMSPGPNMLQ